MMLSNRRTMNARLVVAPVVVVAAGIHKERSMSWIKYFDKYPEMQTRAMSVLGTCTQRFDAANGTSLLQKLLQALGG